MIVRNLVPSFAAFAASVTAADHDLVGRWRESVVEPHAGVYRAITSWVDPADAAEALPGLVARGDDLAVAADRARRAVERAAGLLRTAIPDAEPFEAVVLVGLGQANGWAAPVAGTPTLFLAVEQLPAPGYDVLLALHELVHVVHQQRAARDWPDDLMAADLFREGLAVHATALLMPELGESGRLWCAPDADEWIARCARAGLAPRALADLERDDVSDLWFRGRMDRPGELPGRCGYWLGARLVRGLDSPIKTLLDMPLPEVIRELRKVLRTG